MTEENETRTAPATRTPRWILVTIIGFFGLLYAFAVWNGVGQLIAQAQYLAALESSLSLTGWIVWLLTIALPIVIFAIVVSLGRRAGAGRLALLLVAGLSIVAVFWLDVLAYAAASLVSMIA
ncbi:MAG: hypothetical protein ACTHZX_03070 [Microbacterium sp.]